MKKIIMLLVSVVLLGGTALAHTEQSCQKAAGCQKPCASKVDSYVAAFELNESDAAKFKGMYEEYVKELVAIKTKANEGRKAGMTEAEIETFIKNNINADKSQAELQSKYYDQFKTILTPTQILSVFNGRVSCPKAAETAKAKCSDCEKKGTSECDKAAKKCDKAEKQCCKKNAGKKCEKGDKCCKNKGTAKCDKESKKDCCKEKNK